MNERLFRFEIQVREDMRSFETFPIFDDYGALIGGFTRRQDNLICGFISGTGYPLALYVSTEESFYFTAYLDKTGFVSHGTISDKPITSTSVKIQAAHEENLDVKKPKEE